MILTVIPPSIKITVAVCFFLPRIKQNPALRDWKNWSRFIVIFKHIFPTQTKPQVFGVPGFNITLGYNKYTDYLSNFLSFPQQQHHSSQILPCIDGKYTCTIIHLIRGVYWLSEHKIQTAFLPYSDLHYVVG